MSFSRVSFVAKRPIRPKSSRTLKIGQCALVRSNQWRREISRSTPKWEKERSSRTTDNKFCVISGQFCYDFFFLQVNQFVVFYESMSQSSITSFSILQCHQHAFFSQFWLRETFSLNFIAKKKNERRKNILAILQTPFVRSVSLLFFSNVQLLLRASRVSHTLSWRNYIFFSLEHKICAVTAIEMIHCLRARSHGQKLIVYAIKFNIFTFVSVVRSPRKRRNSQEKKKSRRKKIIALRQQLTNCVAWVTNKNAVT